MAYLFSFIGGVAVGIVIMLLTKNKTEGNAPEVIKTIIERSIEAYKQNKKTEEIVAEINDLLNQ